MSEPNDDEPDSARDELDDELRDLADEANGGPGRFWRGLVLAVVCGVAFYVGAVLFLVLVIVPSSR